MLRTAARLGHYLTQDVDHAVAQRGHHLRRHAAANPAGGLPQGHYPPCLPTSTFKLP
jgi:hypothetical protein